MKAIGIIGLLLLAAMVVIMGMMATAVPPLPPIVDVNIPDNPVELEFVCEPIIEVLIDPDIEVELAQGAPRYDEDDVIMAMKERDYPWPPKVFVPEHQHGRIWYVMVTFNVGVHSHKRLYIFDEPL